MSLLSRLNKKRKEQSSGVGKLSELLDESDELCKRQDNALDKILNPKKNGKAGPLKPAGMIYSKP